MTRIRAASTGFVGNGLSEDMTFGQRPKVREQTTTRGAGTRTFQPERPMNAKTLQRKGSEVLRGAGIGQCDRAGRQGKAGLSNDWRNEQGLISHVLEDGFYFTCNGKSCMGFNQVSGRMPMVHRIMSPHPQMSTSESLGPVNILLYMTTGTLWMCLS